ncbi:expressed unknown protein [Seminavis robusta]|uniref:Uncharacterized protein n=1 Tax=Seminavis robusta TaxID=568900 RepID=A0A9N8H1M3_9STRA|nr:expressed unknown protein [Seminavis robusta]|eukprot:Sro19_g013750.1 n/a (148) ;mRNA; r:173072-173515
MHNFPLAIIRHSTYNWIQGQKRKVRKKELSPSQKNQLEGLGIDLFDRIWKANEAWRRQVGGNDIVWWIAKVQVFDGKLPGSPAILNKSSFGKLGLPATQIEKEGLAASLRIETGETRVLLEPKGCNVVKVIYLEGTCLCILLGFLSR